MFLFCSYFSLFLSLFSFLLLSPSFSLSLSPSLSEWRFFPRFHFSRARRTKTLLAAIITQLPHTINRFVGRSNDVHVRENVSERPKLARRNKKSLRNWSAMRTFAKTLIHSLSRSVCGRSAILSRSCSLNAEKTLDAEICGRFGRQLTNKSSTKFFVCWLRVFARYSECETVNVARQTQMTVFFFSSLLAFW